MRTAFASLCFVLGGCSSLLGIDDLRLTDGGVADDDGVPPNVTCFGSYQVCIPPPSGMLVTPNQINTDSDPSCTFVIPGNLTSGVEVCAIGADTIMIPNVTQVIGRKPLALVATGAITIGNLLDASTNQPSTNLMVPAACQAAIGGPMGGGGGGGGGGFGSPGATGGTGTNGVGGSGGPGIPFPPPITRGCPGAQGGGPNNGGLGGQGGGAVYLVSNDRIVLGLGALILAGGAGGAGGGANSNGGGGGGGSGGFIGLEAAILEIDGGVFANGGGGGGGAAIGNGQDGGAGGLMTTGSPGGKGGTDPTNTGGDGGVGGARDTTTGGGGSPLGTGGGGGGGGGAGYVIVMGNLTGGGTISPQPANMR